MTRLYKMTGRAPSISVEVADYLKKRTLEMLEDGEKVCYDCQITFRFDEAGNVSLEPRPLDSRTYYGNPMPDIGAVVRAEEMLLEERPLSGLRRLFHNMASPPPLVGIYVEVY